MPRIKTVLSLTLSKPAFCAAVMPRSTLFKSPTRVIFLNFSAFKLSRLMLIRLTPATLSAWACCSSCEPLVVVTSSLRPESLPISSNNQSAFIRTRGSPPVMRTLETPSATKALTTRRHSSSESTSSRGRNSMFSLMQ